MEMIQTFQKSAMELKEKILLFMENDAKFPDLSRLEDLTQCQVDKNHWVPTTSLPQHLRKCHGTKFYESYESHDFFYAQSGNVKRIVFPPSNRSKCIDPQTHPESPRLNRVYPEKQPDYSAAYFEEEEKEKEEIRSLIEVNQEALQSESTIPARESIAKICKSISLQEFYNMVRKWKLVPREYKQLDIDILDGKKIKGWTISQIDKLFPTEELDMDLANYVLSLLEHPGFCQPDIMVAELHEFFGKKTVLFVLALWKYLVVEMAIESIYKQETTKSSSSLFSTHKLLEATWQKEKTDSQYNKIVGIEKTFINEVNKNQTAIEDYKRRRPSFRAKNTHLTKRSPNEVLRDFLSYHMKEYSELSGRQILSLRDCLHVDQELLDSVHSEALEPVRIRLEKIMSLSGPLKVRDIDRMSKSPCFGYRIEDPFCKRRCRKRSRSFNNSRSVSCDYRKKLKYEHDQKYERRDKPRERSSNRGHRNTHHSKGNEKYHERRSRHSSYRRSRSRSRGLVQGRRHKRSFSK